MAIIYHLVSKDDWEQSGEALYRSSSLATEGFIHCSFKEQIGRVANHFFSAVDELLILSLETDKLTSPLRMEACNTGDLYPHIYGPINREAITDVRRLGRDTQGHWVFE